MQRFNVEQSIAGLWCVCVFGVRQQRQWLRINFQLLACTNARPLDEYRYVAIERTHSEHDARSRARSCDGYVAIAVLC